MSQPRARKTRPQAAPSAGQPLYFNRELSWLAFNQRVLDEAVGSRWPLLERLKFLAIHSNNLDEFFMIRVSGLHEQLEADIARRSIDGLTPAEQLTRIRALVLKQVEQEYSILSRDLLPALERAGVRLRAYKSLDHEMRRRAREYFHRSVFPVLTPLAVDPGHPFPFLSNLSLSLAIEARDPDSDERKFARVKVPEVLPRFIRLETLGDGEVEPADNSAANYLPLEDLIAENLDELFPGMEILGCHPFRITRDMDLEFREEEARDLLETVDRELRRRKFGAAVRLEVAKGVPARVRHLLVEKLEITDDDLYECDGPLGLAGFFSIAGLNRPDLRDPTFTPQIHPAMAGPDFFGAIRAGDILNHRPYQSFVPLLNFLRAAAEDPQVLAIKMTLYRTGDHSDIVPTLISAAENGKQVAVSIELKARFDEQTNIAGARRMEEAGIHVFFGSAEVKTHVKATMAVRREKDELRRYIHLSTGNYNAATSRTYTDLGFFTADHDIADDISEMFNSLSGFSRTPSFSKIAVAPLNLADTIIEKIEAQTERARKGQPACIFAKLNAIEDKKTIDALYAASQAGVSINLCVRGICCLRPGLPGLSENIRVFSIVGRFLEHERVAVFGPPGEEEFYFSSADWMPRNFRHRVEIMVPIEDDRLRNQVRRFTIEPALADNCSARDLDSEGVWHRRQPAAGEPERNAQHSVLAHFSQRQLQRVV